MKKPLFVITEIFLSAVFVAAAAAAAAVAVDIKTDMFHIDKLDPLKISGMFSSAKQESSSDSSVRKEVSAMISDDEKKASKTVSPAKQEESKDSTQSEASSEASAEETKEDSSGFIEEPQYLEIQPDELVELAEAYEYTFEDDLNGNKLILVEADNSSNTSKAKIYCYDKTADGYWWNCLGDGNALTEDAYIGENGSGYDITADSKKTPSGIWTLGEGFYIGEKPDTTYPMFEITENTYWITDEKSKFFNKKVEGTDQKDWSKADHMISSEQSYKYGIVVNYNTDDPVKGKGSAVFIHCGDKPTEGCIAVPEDIMQTILELFDKDSKPMVWVTV